MLATTATRNIETICETIVSHEKMANEDDLRVGVSGIIRTLLTYHEPDQHVPVSFRLSPIVIILDKTTLTSPKLYLSPQPLMSYITSSTTYVREAEEMDPKPSSPEWLLL
jgi:hypothetical protein